MCECDLIQICLYLLSGAVLSMGIILTISIILGE